VSRATFGSLPWRSRSQRDLAAKSCPANNFVIWSRISKIFHRNDHHTKTTCHAQHLGPYLEGQGHSATLQQNRVQLITFYLKSDFETISQKWSPNWDDVSRTTFGLLILRSRSQPDIAAKSCPAHNFVIWSRISKIFQRNDHHIDTTCRAQHLGPYHEGQGHSATLQQNRVRPKTLLFEVGFRKYFKEMITILRRCVAYNIWVATFKRVMLPISKIFHRNDHHIDTTCLAQHLGCYLEGQGHSMTIQQNRVRPITLLFEVGFRKYFTEMITILTRRVTRNIWVATLKVKVTAWPFSKIVSGP